MQLCSAIGFGLSSYAFLHNRGFVSGSICTINATINCDVVNKGPFSEFFGVPVALIGLLGYFLLFVGATLKKRSMEDKMLTLFLFGLAVGGFGFSLYLTSIEATILHAWCLVCVSSQLAMLGYITAIIKLAHDEEHFHAVFTKLRSLFVRRS